MIQQQSILREPDNSVLKCVYKSIRVDPERSSALEI